MKKAFLLAICMFFALAAAGHAQPAKEGGGMMKGMEMNQKMSPCMEKMHTMMQSMHKMMGKEMKAEDRAKMAEVMKCMSKHMVDMSMMMEKGHCTMDEMNKMEKDVSDTEKMSEEIENYM